MWTGVPLHSDIAEWECPCVDQMILDRWLGVRGIPRGFRRMGVLDAYGVSQTAREWVSQWASKSDLMVHHGEGVTITGSLGSGKTLVASLVQKRLLSKKVECWMARAQSFGNMTEDWRREEVRDWWRTRVRGAPVLVIDGLGSEQGNLEWIGARLSDLFHYRSSNSMSTIVTTDISIEKLRAKYKQDGLPDLVSVMLDACPVIDISRSESFIRKDVQDAEKAHGIRRPYVLESHLT